MGYFNLLLICTWPLDSLSSLTWQVKAFPSPACERENERKRNHFCHSEGEKRPKNLVITNKYEILRLARDDKETILK